MKKAAAEARPCEACGLLFGVASHITAFAQTRNVAAAPETRFEIDPAALFAALRTERAGGATLLGYWHSHPSGDPLPSATDAAMAAADGKLWLVLGGNDVTCWRAGTRGRWDRFDAVSLILV